MPTTDANPQPTKSADVACGLTKAGADPNEGSRQPLVCQSIDWYAEGQSRTVEVNGIEVTFRYVGRKGRRARIAITAPAGAVFRGGGVCDGGPA